jgi:opacity protein-like surface antigen
MMRILAGAVMIACVATTTVAADTVVMQAKNGNVTFNHAAHNARLECKVCHPGGKPGKIDINKATAHRLCKGCHESKQGPTKCGDCHRK